MLWWVAEWLCESILAAIKRPLLFRRSREKTSAAPQWACRLCRFVCAALQGAEVSFWHVPARKLKMFALFQNLEHSPTLVWCRRSQIELNRIIRTILRRHQRSHINTDNLRCLRLSRIQCVCACVSETNSSGAHTAGWKIYKGSFIWRKRKFNVWLFKVILIRVISWSSTSTPNTAEPLCCSTDQMWMKIYDDTLCDNVPTRSCK